MKDIGKIIFFTFLGISFIFFYDVYIKYAKENSVQKCTDKQLIISDWGICTEGIQEREIRFDEKICRLDEDIFPRKQPCKPIFSSGSTNTGAINNSGNKKVSIFSEPYTTEIDTEKRDYSKSYDNFSITLSGSIKSLKLHILGETQVNGGKRIFIPETYYYMFSINDKYPRILGTSRKQQNRIDTSGIGVFQGTETPKRLDFNLSSIELAATSDEFIKGNTKIIKNYVDILNANSGKRLSGTLLMGDGNSMLEPDILNRIFGIITEAYFEYECEEGSDCLITIE